MLHALHWASKVAAFAFLPIEFHLTLSFAFVSIFFVKSTYSAFAGEYSFSSPSLDWPAFDSTEGSDASLPTNAATSDQQESKAQKRRLIRRALGVIPRLFHLSF